MVLFTPHVSFDGETVAAKMYVHYAIVRRGGCTKTQMWWHSVSDMRSTFLIQSLFCDMARISLLRPFLGARQGLYATTIVWSVCTFRTILVVSMVKTACACSHFTHSLMSNHCNLTNLVFHTRHRVSELNVCSYMIFVAIWVST